MKNLILFTNVFPYGKWEPYLETEVKYYEQHFDQILICSLQLRKKDFQTVRELPSDKFKVLPIAKTHGLIYLLYCFRVLGDKNLYKELLEIIKKREKLIARTISLFIFLSRSYYEAHKIKNWLKIIGVINDSESGVLYSYRFEYQPYVELLVRKILPDYASVARGHRFDLYEDMRSIGYIPLRSYILGNINKAVMISDDGVNYLSSKYPNYKNRIIVSRLGTSDYGLATSPLSMNELRLVSCSTISNVKRLHLIVQALAKIEDVTVYWDHYGDGTLSQEIKNLALRCLSQNIHYKFHGHVDNQTLMCAYKKNPYHVFLNVSSSEGIPVSIMEAMSFGLPCIATNVGGTGEIVKDKYNGILLNSDFDVQALTGAILHFFNMDEHEYLQYRSNARTSWNENYNADKNYSEFVEFLNEL